jgi:lipoprotein-releasing system permease protein
VARFEQLMALRYLKGAEGRAEGRSFLRFITYVAIGGVAVGVTALLLSLAIVRGFSREIQSKITGVGAHVKVESYMQGEPLGEASSKSRQLEAMDGVTGVVPVVQDVVLLRRSADAIDGVVLLGSDRPADYLRENVVAGSFDLQGTDKPGLVVGRQLARRLGLEVGQRLTLFSMRSGGSARSVRRPRVQQVEVTGIYQTSLTNIDDVYVFSSLATARRITGVAEGRVSYFDVSLSDLSRADSVAARVEESMGFPVAARTIYQQYSGLFAWIDLQENIIPLVIGVIVLVAAFNIVGALLMLILEKTREIGVLQSLGASGRLVKRLFLVLGLLIGTVGTAIGSGLALTLGLLQQRFQIIPLPAEAYFMTSAPVELNLIDFVLVGGVTLALCALAAYIPARVAARVEPVRAIRFE